MNQKTSNPVLISFSGMDGSGKSTQIESLCASLAAAGISVARVTFWDDVVGLSKWRAGFSHKFLKSTGEIGRPGKPARRNDKNNRAWYLLMARSALYLLDAWRLRAATNRVRRRDCQVVVFDRYIYDQLATLPVTWLSKPYMKLVLRIAPRADLGFVLDAEPEIARERKPEYPVEFLHKYRESYLAICRLAGLVLIPPGSLEATRLAIAKRVAERCDHPALVPDGIADVPTASPA